MDYILIAYYTSHDEAEQAAKELGLRFHEYTIGRETAEMDTEVWPLYKINRFNID